MAQGFVRLRRNQFGVQTVIGTAVAATRRVPWRGAVVYNPNRTNPDIDVGSLDPVVAPYPLAPSVTSNKTGPLAFNDLPLRLNAGLIGGVTAAGSTWTYTVASLTADAFQYFTNEFGDDTEATDMIIGYGGVIDTLEESMSDDLGPWQISDGWVFAGATLGGNGTDSLNVDSAPTWVFGKDTTLKLNSTAATIGTTLVSDALHAATFRVSNNLDQKRYANGSNSGFNLSAYGRGTREIEFVLTLAKTSATITEAATLDDDPVPNRYIEILTTPSATYSYNRRAAVRLFERSEGEINGNTVIVLTYRAFYDSTLLYALKCVVVNTQATVAAA